jgi:phosphoglycerate-specific signal transduction histidine kinase
VSDDLGLMLADRVQIEQILLNLAVNARDAMSQGGRINIETMNVILDKEYAKQHPPSASGPFVMLAFSDTGHGIDKTVLPKIFEPFFSQPKSPARAAASVSRRFMESLSKTTAIFGSTASLVWGRHLRFTFPKSI